MIKIILKKTGTFHGEPVYRSGPFTITKQTWELPREIEWEIAHDSGESFGSYPTLREAKDELTGFIESAIASEIERIQTRRERLVKAASKSKKK